MTPGPGGGLRARVWNSATSGGQLTHFSFPTEDGESHTVEVAGTDSRKLDMVKLFSSLEAGVAKGSGDEMIQGKVQLSSISMQSHMQASMHASTQAMLCKLCKAPCKAPCNHTELHMLCNSGTGQGTLANHRGFVCRGYEETLQRC